ncbi:hypothetical protein K458DRAFT_100760 [Lentithecium fluviatile CBS 122367]|uniref:Uncharacterized protein n=1 Tax=Lentithecium fluviatile CBS 122367 TaxID=1168545 RepID=A0A6G1JI83_9PLEO|nr:hypothetical protein K458DRAFT_100760 [Lentithecium fluviatile CBS 122367]
MVLAIQCERHSVHCQYHNNSKCDVKVLRWDPAYRYYNPYCTPQPIFHLCPPPSALNLPSCNPCSSTSADAPPTGKLNGLPPMMAPPRPQFQLQPPRLPMTTQRLPHGRRRVQVRVRRALLRLRLLRHLMG